MKQYGWKVKMDHKFQETWNSDIRPRIRQLPDLLPLFIRYFIWWVGTWLIRRVKPFIDLYMLTGKQIYGIHNHIHRQLIKMFLGVPLGGVGSGTIGRGFKGEFCRFQMTPGLYEYNVCHADQFIPSVRDSQNSQSLYQKVLSGTTKPKTLSSWDWSFKASDGHYLGLYPRAWYTYNVPEQNFIVQCKQISPVIPNNYKDSCMPAAAFVWRVKNNSSQAKQISITFTFKNGTGSSQDGKDACTSQTFTSSRLEENGFQNIKGVSLEHKIQGLNTTYGVGCLQKGNQEITNMTKFDLKTGKDLWEQLLKTGHLSSESSTVEISKGELGVALCCSTTVEANSSEEMTFSLVWHQPKITFKGKKVEHIRRYTKFLDNKVSKEYPETLRETTIAVEKLTKYCLTNYGDWDKKISEWQNPILRDMKLPDWFKSALFNELYFVSDGGSVWLEYNTESLPRTNFSTKLEDDIRMNIGRFAYLEAHEYRMYNTYDVHFYASFALAMLWPELQLSLQYDMADAIKFKDDTIRIHLFDGSRSARKHIDSVCHDLGDPSEDPFLKINSYRMHDVSEWRDLNLKFILQVFRDYKFTKNITYLKDMLPICSTVMKKSMEWDKDNDGLIENSGSADQTYDTWIMTGASSYCGGLYLASLFAMIEMLKLIDDMDEDVKKSDLQLYEETLSRRKKSFHDKLWTGDYYRFDSSGASHGNSIMADQLCGYWFLIMAGNDVNASSVFPEANVNKALHTIFNNNVQSFCDGTLGAANGMNPDGKTDEFTMQSEEFWTGVTYALASTMIYNGMIEEGFKTAEGIYRTVYEKIGMGYETPEALYRTKQYRAIGYMRPLSIWSIMHSWNLKRKQ